MPAGALMQKGSENTHLGEETVLQGAHPPADNSRVFLWCGGEGSALYAVFPTSNNIWNLLFQFLLPSLPFFLPSVSLSFYI